MTSKIAAIDQDRKALYDKIQEGKDFLDTLYPIVDRIRCDTVIGDRKCSGHSGGMTPAHVLRDYTLIFNDDFSQGSLDPQKWNTRYPWPTSQVINQEAQHYFDTLGGDGPQDYSPFSFTDNSMLITAGVLPEGHPSGQRIGSGVITTRDSCCFKYGYAEACVRDPCCPDGMWTAVWLLNCIYYDNGASKNANENGGTGSDKFNFEIDIKESVANFGCETAVRHGYHYFTGDRNQTHSRWSIDGGNFIEVEQPTAVLLSQNNLYTGLDGQQKTTLQPTSGLNCQDFQVVGVDWCPEYIHFYVNGQLVAGITGPMDLISDQEMYLIINFAVGGNYPFGSVPRQPNLADYPASMEIQWARIYGHPDGRFTKNSAVQP